MNTQILLGNIACDMIRPEDAKLLPKQLKLGMDLHQEIDRYTDSHSGFKTVRDLLNNNKLPYAGVFTDIIFDHCLAENWENYSYMTLSDFTREIYRILSKSIEEQIIPGHFNRLAKALVSDDWFGSYVSREGLERALNRLNYRSSREIPVELIMTIVERDIERINEGFDELMNDLLLNFPCRSRI